MSRETPIISVVMPVYNGERFMREAIDSILNQTYKDFEFIIIDDGSTDQTSAILDSYHDPRIVRLTHPTNLGLVQSLNDGIAIARGEYIARMDADDISLPERFEKQVAFMESHPEIGVLGTNTYYIDENGKFLHSSHFVETPFLIKWQLYFYNPIAHPTALIQRALFSTYFYEERYKAAEDYALWTRISKDYSLYNLPEALLLYRLHENKISTNFSLYQANSTNKIIIEHWYNTTGLSLTEEQVVGLSNIKLINSRGDGLILCNAMMKLLKLSYRWGADKADYRKINKATSGIIYNIYKQFKTELNILLIFYMFISILLYTSSHIDRIINSIQKHISVLNSKIIK